MGLLGVCNDGAALVGGCTDPLPTASAPMHPNETAVRLGLIIAFVLQAGQLNWALAAGGPGLANETARAEDEAVGEQAAFPEGRWRELGPAVFGGRVVDIEIAAGKPSSIWVASASGGLWYTENNGVTWRCIFQEEGTISIGDVALDPKNEEVIWVGTGEANNQRSSYWGDGIYKTTDGGESWHNMGLPKSQHIGRIVVDPGDSDRVYVAVLGNLYSPNPERGVYRTLDGGQHWEHVLQPGEDVGAVDLVIDPGHPETLYAATYERRRRAWDFDGSGPGSAIYKSEDGGDHWHRLEGGLPTGEIGRIGLSLHGAAPGTLYVTLANLNEVEVPQEEPVSLETTFRGGRLEVRKVQAGGGAAQAGLEKGDVLLQLGDVALDNVWAAAEVFGMAAEPALAAEGEVAVTVIFERDGERKELEVKLSDLMRAKPNAKRFKTVGGEIWRSTDGGATFEKRNEKSAGGSPPYYYGQIRVDPNDVEQVYLLGVPLTRSEDGGATWSGNIARSVHVDHHALVVDPKDSQRLLLGNDGGLHQSYDRGKTWYHYENLPLAQFYAVGVDMAEPYNVYGGTQDNGTWGGPSRSARRGGIEQHEWYSVGGGDGFYAVPDPRDPATIYGESQFGMVYRRDLKSGSSKSIRPRAPKRASGEDGEQEQERYRFNWNSPIVVSHHNPEIIYFGGNRLFKSFNRGDEWPIRSEDLTTQDPEKLKGNVPHCTITTIAESPFDPLRVLVGTDDGLVQLSEDGCLTFTNLAGRFPGVPTGWWVNRVEFSAHDQDLAWAVFTGYREDDFRPFVYRTRNGGASWELIVDGLHQAPVNVIREDPKLPGLLYLGTELGGFYTLDGGDHWQPLGQGLPTLAVYDLVVHPRDGEIVAGTHGRGFWILDVSLYRQLTPENLEADVHLFEVQDSVRLPSKGNFAWSGDGHWAGTNPANGVAIDYRLATEHKDKDVKVEVFDVRGKRLSSPEAGGAAGFHRVFWSGRGAGGGRRSQSRSVASTGAGEYRVVLTVGEQSYERWMRVRTLE